MLKRKYFKSLFIIAFFSVTAIAQHVSPDNWGAPQVKVTHEKGRWIIAGKTNQVVLNELDLVMKINAGPVDWAMSPSQANEMMVRWRDEDIYLSLSDAGIKNFFEYKTGYKSGVKIRLEDFQTKNKGKLDLKIVLTICLEGKTEYLICEAVAIEKEASLRQLDWPKDLDANEVDYTVLSHGRGLLLPRNWPKPYFAKKSEVLIQSNQVGSWSMSWWGFQKGESAMILIVETPADASFNLTHPAGGPTVMGPRWLASLGKFSYPRSIRMCFFPDGNYTTLAKRYRKYIMDIGKFVSLKEKIIRRPLVESLVGATQYRQYALITGKSFKALGVLLQKPAAKTFDPDDPEKNFGLRTFDELIQDLRDIKAGGIDRMYVTMCGWPTEGYNRRHPDPLPPAPKAGGWAGLKKWNDACAELGYPTGYHDQYRDYYFNAASFNPELAIHIEDSTSRPKAFGYSLRNGWMEGSMPAHNTWGGGNQTYLNPKFGLGHLKKNQELLFEHGIHLNGAYIDVFGAGSADEDFSPEHPMSRSQSLEYRAKCFSWVRNNLGIVGTESGSDWVVPYCDFASGAGAGEWRCISVPLYNLVYHDAIMTPAGGLITPLRCLLNGGFPWIGQTGEKELDVDMLKTIMTLHKRIALLEMTNHEFIDDTYRKERTTFSDGTTVTIDRDAGIFIIDPPLEF